MLWGLCRLIRTSRRFSGTVATSCGFRFSADIFLLGIDSDTISSHDKKRNYLECLEIYIGYLEDQMKIVKLQSPAIAKIMKVDIGMNNRSLRVSLDLQPCSFPGQSIDRLTLFLWGNVDVVGVHAEEAPRAASGGIEGRREGELGCRLWLFV